MPASGNVSIHAPRCRGAMLTQNAAKKRHCDLFQSTPPVAGGRCAKTDAVCVREIQFQSTPPVAGGRCFDWGCAPGTGRQVSIHAPRCRGAMQSVASKTEGIYAVSIHAPRCRGAMPPMQNPPCHPLCVSIHAPRCRGAMRAGPLRRACPTECFNPRPPLPGGDAVSGCTS